LPVHEFLETLVIFAPASQGFLIPTLVALVIEEVEYLTSRRILSRPLPEEL